LDADQVDLFRFSGGLAAARELRAEGRLDPAWNAYSDTLAIGAARPLLGVGDVPFVADEARRWEELWLDGREEQAAVGLALGRNEEVIDLVDDLGRRYPLRERFLDSLMTALYRCGRHADALAAFQRYRRYLADELGLSPSPTLAELEARILRHDPTLLGSAENSSGISPSPPRSDSASSIGVLPFTDLSPAADQGYFCDGLAEELISHLSAVDGLRVSSPTSSFRYRSSALDVRAIGRELGVAAVLEGSVRRSGDRLRIVARLTDSQSGFQLCSASFDRDAGDIFDVQHEIASTVVAALPAELVVGGHPGSSRWTANVAAYDTYLQGRHLFYRGGRAPTKRACELFRSAVALAPDYAPAHAGLADASTFLLLYYEPGSDIAATAEEHSRRSVSLDPDLPEARSARGLALSARGDYHAATRQFEVALKLHGGQFEALYLFARTCIASGDHERAADLLERASKTRPDDFHVLTLLGKARRGIGAVDSALDAHRRALDLIGHHRRFAPDDARALCDGACALAELGQAGEALRWGEQAIASDSTLEYYVSCALARLGEGESALHTLSDAIAQGWSHADWLRHDPDWSTLRGTPRFAELLGCVARRMRFG
jgi:TolB-like protein